MTEPLRVALDYRPALWSRAGIARSVREIVGALDALEPAPRDVELHLYGDCLRRAPREPSDPPLRAPWIHVHARRVPARLSRWFSRVRGASARCGPLDLLHTTDYVPAPFAGVPRVVTLHDLAFFVDPAFHGPAIGARLERVVRELVAGAIAFVAPSHATAREMQERLGIEVERIRVIPHGCEHVFRIAGDDAQRARREASRERFEIATVGTIEPRKNHLRCLRAFERLLAQGYSAQWRVVGKRGWLVADFFAALERSPARGAVTLRTQGATDREVLSALRADVLLYPSLHEGFGLPVLEAMACGTPVVTSRGGALEELCGDAALLVDPSSEEEIFSALRDLRQDADLRSDLAQRGRERAQRFSWRDAALAHLDLWRALRTSARARS